jgi:DNA anti-recombination protein RmuC
MFCDIKKQERNILRETYKETNGCKSRKGLGHGYLEKYPTQSQIMIKEQARATALVAAAQQKNSEMKAEVDQLKEQLTIQAAERENDQEKIKQLEQQLESTSNKIREELRQEMFSPFKQHNEATHLVIILLLNC